MMDHDLRNVSDADYKRLIAEAYPSPKRDIHAAVMAQVTAEAAQSRKKAKILTPAFRNRFVKYGSMAACFVLLVTLGFRVLPMMTKDAVMESENTMVTADMDYYADEAAPEAPQTEETSAETQASAGGIKNGTPILYKTVLTDSTTMEEPVEEAEEEIIDEPVAAAAYSAEIEADSGIEEGDSSVFTEPEAPMVMMAPAPVAEESAIEEAVTEDCLVEEAIVEECVEECVVEEAVVEEYVEECIVEEAVVKEELAEKLAAPEYYRSASDKAEGTRRMFEYELKLDLYQEVHDQFGYESYDNWMTERGYTDVAGWSIAEFVDHFRISRERFMELYNALTVAFAELHPEYDVPTYDLDKMYSMDTDITDSITAGNPGCVTDELYRQ